MHPDVRAGFAETVRLEIVVVNPEQLRTEVASLRDKSPDVLPGLELCLDDPQAVDRDRLDQRAHVASHSA